MLHGGQRPLDIYRRIHAGINGTPMPSFKDILASEPDAYWQLTHYVLHLADQRRRGVQFAAGSQAPAVAPGGEAPAQPAGQPQPTSESGSDAEPSR
jgi:hypothetical protein